MPNGARKAGKGRRGRRIAAISGRTARIMETGTARGVVSIGGMRQFRRLHTRAYGGGVGGFVQSRVAYVRSLAHFVTRRRR